MCPKQNKTSLPIPEVKRQKTTGGLTFKASTPHKFQNASVTDDCPTANVRRANIKRQSNPLLVDLVNLKKLNLSFAPQLLIDEG